MAVKNSNAALPEIKPIEMVDPSRWWTFPFMWSGIRP